MTYFYTKFYLLSLRVNGEKAFHNYYACLALSLFEVLFFAIVGLLAELVFGGFLSAADSVKLKASFLLIMLVIFLFNYAYFSIGGRVKKITANIMKDTNDSKYYLPGVLIFVVSIIIVFILSAFVLYK